MGARISRRQMRQIAVSNIDRQNFCSRISPRLTPKALKSSSALGLLHDNGREDLVFVDSLDDEGQTTNFCALQVIYQIKLICIDGFE